MNIQGDRPEVNDGTLPMCLAKVYDHFSFGVTARGLQTGTPYTLTVTFFKADERLLRDFSENQNRDFINSLDALLPQKMIPLVVERSGIPERVKVNSITREQRRRLLEVIKRFSIRLTGLRPMEEAIVTAGGVDVSQVQPRTMESRLLSGLYFAGEILDVDARTGGYNLQIAWSTGHAAGQAVLTEE